ncbi:MAG: VWA domain-containing protein [Hyphomicrobiales bacterium]
MAIIATLVMPVLLLFTASMMDYTNAQRLRSASASSLDAALLAAARDFSSGDLQEDDIERFVNDYFEANMVGKGLNASSIGAVSASYNEDTGRISGSVRATANAVFTRILNPDGVAVGVDSEVTVSRLNIELALVLDVTGSMEGAKLRALQDAANELVDILIPQAGSAVGLNSVRISLVPYSDLVNVGGFEEQITGYNSGESCVYERRGRLAYSDQAPVGRVAGSPRDDDGVQNRPPSGNGGRGAKPVTNNRLNFGGFICNNPELLPLTAENQRLTDSINGFTAAGWTAGHIGIQWGWYTLSPQFSGVWPANSTPAAYNDNETLKVMVVMTDGAFNTWYQRRAGNSFRQGERLCDEIKEDGIEVFTVGFMTGTSEESFLRDCATDPDHYIDASSSSELIDAFRNIADMLNDIRLAS